VARMGELVNFCNILVGNPDGKRSPERHRRRRENNIRMYIREIVWGIMDWIHLAQIGTSSMLL